LTRSKPTSESLGHDKGWPNVPQPANPVPDGPARTQPPDGASLDDPLEDLVDEQQYECDAAEQQQH